MVNNKYIEHKIIAADKAFKLWRETTFKTRKDVLLEVSKLLKNNKEIYGKIINEEMGKNLTDAIFEVEKSAWVCEYYANNAEEMLKDEVISTEAEKSYVRLDPLGIVFAVMPWNFPFWQVFRFAAPSLMAGNSCILKHASNVPRCSKIIEKIFNKAGLPKNVFISFIIPSTSVEEVIKNEKVKAITLTGSEEAGKNVAQLSGKYLKRVVLELGGSDPFIIFADSNIKEASKMAAISRMIVSGQSCIAAKRFIVEDSIYEKFIKLFGEELSKIDYAPLVSQEAAKTLDKQLRDSIKMGAKVTFIGKGINKKGFYFKPAIVTNIKKGMPIWREETFGPVAPIMKFKKDGEALKLANDSRFGLGASLWTKSKKRIDYFSKNLEAGSVFVNSFVKSDPRIPFGGTKMSGYGRELGSFGIKEFVNIKSVWINS